MITPINNSIGFKGIYTDKNSKFSESQQRAIDDIKKKLKDESVKKNFFINQGKYKETVSLSQVYGLKDVGVGVDTFQTYDHEIYIGTYDESHPFVIEDLQTARRERNEGVAAFGLVTIGLIALGFFASVKGGKNFIPMPKPEHKAAVMKDSLASDSAKILKSAFNK